MAAVTQTIQSYLGGVSNQPDDKKLPGQVKQAINAYPDPTFGLTKRPGYKFLTELKDGVYVDGSAYDNEDLDNAKWFYYNRDADERYLGCIIGKSTSSYGEIHVWNAIQADGVAATTSTLSGGSGYSTANEVATTGGTGTGLTVNIGQSGGTVNSVTINDGGEGYTANDEITITGGGGNATFRVATITNNVNKKCNVTYGTDAREYLGKKETDDVIASTLSTDYDFITIRDTTIVINKNRVVKETTAPSENANFNGTVRINTVEYSSKYEVTITKGGVQYVCICKTRAGDTAVNNADNTFFLSANDILSDLRAGTESGDNEYAHTNAASGLNGISGITATIIGTSIELTGTGAFTIDSVVGGKGGEALTAYQDSVDSITQLAAEAKNDRVVKIQNTDSGSDTYYVKFVANNGTSGPGVWEETIGPGVSTGLNHATMPHHLYNIAKNKFVFSQIDGNNQDGSTATAGTLAANKWTNRLVGDTITNESPAFVGYTLKQAFYYNNRLGFLSEDNVEMSQVGEFFNFYMITAQTATDSDPIGISCSSTRPATLHGIIPTAAGLLLFSQNQQFILFSSEGNLTPSTALIRGISNYRMDSKINPVDVGTHINFVSKTHDTAGFTRVFGLLPQAAGQAPKVVDVGRVVAEYIPATITALTASPQNSFIAMYGTSDDKIYFYRTYSDGERDIMQTWFNWQCPGNTHFVEVDSDTMYSVLKTGTGSSARYNLCSATMTQTPEEEIITNAAGKQINPHMDFYKATTAVSEYPVQTVTVTAGGTSYSGTPTVAIAAPSSGTQATATATVAGNAVTAITITNPGKGYDPANPPAVSFSGGGGSGAAATAVIYDGSYCQIPFSNLTALEPVMLISGNASDNFSGSTQSGLAITPGRASVNSVDYFTVPKKDLSADTDNVYLGYKYSYDVTLPKLYYRKDPEGRLLDYTANLTIGRMKFSVGQSSVVGFKLNRKGVQESTETFTGNGTLTAFSPSFKVLDKRDVIVKRNGAKQTLVTSFSGTADERKSQYTIADHDTITDAITVTFGTAPAKSTFWAFGALGTGYSNATDVATTGGKGSGLTVDITVTAGAITAATVNQSGTGYAVNDVVTVTGGGANAKLMLKTLPDELEVYVDNWYTLNPTQEANYYLGDDVPIEEQNTFTVPIHQKTENYTLRIFSDSPFPLALTSMTWEGQYSPRYYKRL